MAAQTKRAFDLTTFTTKPNDPTRHTGELLMSSDRRHDDDHLCPFCDVPKAALHWPNFSPAEIACRGTGAIKFTTEAIG